MSSCPHCSERQGDTSNIDGAIYKFSTMKIKEYAIEVAVMVCVATTYVFVFSFPHDGGSATSAGR